MKASFALVITVCLSLTVTSSSALALFLGRPNQMAGQDWATRGYNAKSGKCPVGTCSLIGTSFAKNLNACKASNCPNRGSK